MFDFIIKNTVSIFPRLKNLNGFHISCNNTPKNVFSYELNEIFSFSELEKQYYLFNNLSKLSITIITNCNFKRELAFLLKSFQIPIVRRKYNSNGRV